MLTARHLVDFVLNEEVNEGHQRAKEETGEPLPVLGGYRIRRTQGKTAQGPWQGGHKIADHEDVVPVMVISRGNVGPPAACKGPKDADPEHDLWQRRVRPRSEEIVERNKGESWSRGQGNANHED